MSLDYKENLNKIVSKKKIEIPTIQTENSTKKIFEILENMPEELTEISNKILVSDFEKPIIAGKRTFRETLVHLLNIEALNYTTVYPAFLLDNPEIYPLHSERDINRLGLFDNFSKAELLSSFKMERNKTLNFLKKLNLKQWSARMTENGKQRQETIYWRARGLALHDFTHILILKFQLDIQVKDVL